MVQIRHSREEVLGTSLSITNDQSMFAATFNLIHLYNRACSLENVVHHLFVDLKRVISGLLQKGNISHLPDISFLFWCGVLIDELALCYKVAAELRCHAWRHSSVGSVRLKTVSQGTNTCIEELFIDSIVIATKGVLIRYHSKPPHKGMIREAVVRSGRMWN